MAAGGLAPYIDAHFAEREDPAYIGLCVAENLQVFDLLHDKLSEARSVPAHVAAYDDMSGKPRLREAVADLLGDRVFGRHVAAEHVQLLAGVSAVLDAVGHALGDPGDGVLVPTPSYAGFWPDLQVRPGLEIVPVPTAAADGFRLTTDDLDHAFETAGRPVRVLLLTNPDNPRGAVLSGDEVDGVLRWAAERDLHVLADEIYALSVFGDLAFSSAGRLRDPLGDRLHVAWGFSKDFAMSGLRAGVLVTENDALRRAVDLQGIWAGVSGHTQHLLADMLEDRAWTQDYLAAMRAQLRSSARRVGAELDDAGLEHIEPDAGFFMLCDLRRHLDEPSFEAEHRLWSELLEQTRVNLTPGSACRAPEPGWFRLCHASAAPERAVEAVRRIAAHLDTRDRG